MERKYPAKLFLIGLLMNFFLRHFYLFLPGTVLCILGIWVRPSLWIGLGFLCLDLILSLISQLQIRRISMTESDNPEFNKLMDTLCGPGGTDEFMQIIDERIQSQAPCEPENGRNILQKLVVYRTLRDTVRDGMTLEELVDAFAEMCEISVGDPDDLLFETGTYDFTGEKRFYFSLVRQFQFMDENEYVQLHLDVMYAPGTKTALLRNTKWGEPGDGEFFNMIKSSRAFRVVKDLPIDKAVVRVDET